MNHVSRPAVAMALLLALSGARLQAQAVCSSDGQPPAKTLMERFINADCEGCWTNVRVPATGEREVVLDWIVPGSRGDDAPLSAAARPEAVARLAALARPVPPAEDARRQRRRGPPVQLRVARGPAFHGYVGASIELQDAGPGPWRAWLLLVEAIPAGSERTPVARILVRNVLQLDWDAGGAGPQRLFESRPMNIPEGARPERLGVVGVIEDTRGRVRGIAQARCAPPSGKG